MKKSFDTWMKEVSRHIARSVGVAADDLPDWCYRDAFDDGVSPSQAARRAIKAAKEY